MKASAESMAAEEKLFYCNGVMKLDFVIVVISQRERDRCLLFGGLADRGRLVLPFVFLAD